MTLSSALITFTTGLDEAARDERPEAHTVVIPMLVRWARVDHDGVTDIALHLRDGARFDFLNVHNDKARELEKVLAQAVEDYYAGRR